MATFSDKTGSRWEIIFTPAVIAAVTGELKLPHPTSGDFYTRLADTATMVDVLYACCEKQAELRGLNVDQFTYRLRSPKVARAAADALVEAALSLLSPIQRLQASRRYSSMVN